MYKTIYTYTTLLIILIFCGDLLGATQTRDRVSKGGDITVEDDRVNSQQERQDSISTTYDVPAEEFIVTDRNSEVESRLPLRMSLKDYIDYEVETSVAEFWRRRFLNESFKDDRSGLFSLFASWGEDPFSTVFGSDKIVVEPQGFLELSVGAQISVNNNPVVTEEMRRVTTLQFDENINFGVTGSIGDKLSVGLNYNTNATFDFENQLKIAFGGSSNMASGISNELSSYEDIYKNSIGGEDQILKSLDAGNISMQTDNSLIGGSSNLFGVRADMQFGKLSVSTVVSQQQGETVTVQSEGGAVKNEFDINAVDYDENRHFFLGHYFYDTYDENLAKLPLIQSSIKINKIEIWITNTTSSFDNSRNFVAFADLGERGDNRENDNIFPDTSNLVYPANIYPQNGSNSLYDDITTNYSGVRDVSMVTTTLSPLASQGFVSGDEFEKIESARMLDTREYVINQELGYISLTSSLRDDEVLAVAYSYTANGVVYQVGEFSTDGINAPETLILKLLKTSVQTPNLKSWQLMMKNIYRLNSSGFGADDFKVDVVYSDASAGKDLNYLPDGPISEQILLKLLNSDNLNSNGDSYADGVFDWVEGVTINSDRGEIIFPVVEPFGSNLESQMEGDEASISTYVFNELYEQSKSNAREIANKNRYSITGTFQGEDDSEIQLGNSFNLTQGSVRVTAGGQELVENVDYIVDYTMGTVKILNTGLLESNTPISVSSESEDIFSSARKTMVGTQLNYEFNDHLNIGASGLYLNETSLTTKPTGGDESISNFMLGLNGRYTNESAAVTNLVDKLPFHSTREKSFITIEGEYAKLFPGSSNSTGEQGSIYLDDFEGSQGSISLKAQYAWKLASVPSDDVLWPEGKLINNLESGYNRAKLAWYTIDPLLQRSSSNTPSNLKLNPDHRSSHYVREIFINELYPDRDIVSGESTSLTTLDLAIYPEERGPYNFDPDALNSDGTFKYPEEKWGGIMRSISSSDFEEANIEYIEFWMMDPFAEDEGELNSGGDLYIQLGNISEDILRDSRKSFENGLSATGEVDDSYAETVWGRVSTEQSIVNAFDNDSEARSNQDIGFDGLNSETESSFFADYLSKVQSSLTSEAYQTIESDPSADDFHYYRGSDYDAADVGILERYKKYNNSENNSPTDSQSDESYGTAYSSVPDVEDINSDNTLSESESYFQYKLSLRPEDLVVGQNNIVDSREVSVTFANGEPSTITWYQVRVPISTPERTVGSISDLSSIRFMRMIMKGWKESTVVRFASLDLVRSDWRQYELDLTEEDGLSSTATTLTNAAVNIEDNSSKQPVNYILPPDVSQVIDPLNTGILLDEQSMSLTVTDLADGDSRAVYKSYITDMRRYSNLKMYVHAESVTGGEVLSDGDVALFIRLGSDYTENYYEYEVPLNITPSGYYSGSSDMDRETVWPEDNLIDISFDAFTDMKLQRDEAMGATNSTLLLTDEFEVPVEDINGGRNVLKVRGKPNLGEVTSIMIGVRNLQDVYRSPKSVEVWVNELRMSDVDTEGGWAMNGRVVGNLADFATYSLSGQYVSSGFGSIDESIESTSLGDYSAFDLSTTVQLGKLVPEKVGLTAPMYVGYSKEVYKPEYNPLDQDIKLDDALATMDGDEREELESIVNSVTVRKSVNLTNVRLEPKLNRTEKRLYDISNFYGTYAFNTYSFRDIDIESIKEYSTRALLGYGYNISPKPIEPFMGHIKSDWLALIRDFNFNYMPSNISFISDINSYYRSQTYRNITNEDFIVETQYTQDFTMALSYGIQYDLFKSLRLDFSARNMSRVDTPLGSEFSIDELKSEDAYSRFKRNAKDSLFSGNNRSTLYSHVVNASYSVPFSKLPLTDWISTDITYQGQYMWEASAILDDDDDDIILGNSISNQSNLQINGGVVMSTLYGKSPYLQKVNQQSSRGSSRRGSSSRGSSSRGSTSATVTRGRSGANSEATSRKRTVTDKKSLNIDSADSYIIKHSLNTKDIAIEVKDSKGADVKGTFEILSNSRVIFTSTDSIGDVDVKLTGKVDVSKIGKLSGVDRLAGFAMMLKSINLSYSELQTTSMSGFLPDVGFAGTKKYNGISAPGLEFVLGKQSDSFAQDAIKSGWITTDSLQIEPFTRSFSSTLDLRASLIPIPRLKVDLYGNRLFNQFSSEYYIYDHSGSGWNSEPLNRIESGNSRITTITMGTAFESISGQGSYISDAYNTFLDNRVVIAERLSLNRILNASQTEEITANEDSSETEEDNGYPDGYGPESADVIIPAFLAAYSNKPASTVSLDPIPKSSSVKPNWNIQYTLPLSGVGMISKYINTVKLKHGYSSIYSIDSYQTNQNYSEESDGFSYSRSLDDNYYPKYDIYSVSIIENLSPLIGVDIKWSGNLTTSFESSRTRSLVLSLVNNWLTEIVSREYSIGASYKISNLDVILNRKKDAASNDILISGTIGIRDTKSLIRKIVEDNEQVTQGQKNVTYNIDADYALNDQFSIALYIDNVSNDPYVSETYSSSITNFGLTFRFNLDTSKKSTQGLSSLSSYK